MLKVSTAVMRILAVLLLAAVDGSAAAQQAYPSKPIRYIVPYPPGGGSNILARIVGQKLADNLSQQVIVDNRPGGNTVIGTEALVKSAPDGYTILQVASSHVVNPHMFPTPYDAIKDFVAIATISSTELILVFHPSVPTNTLQEVIALAKSKPGELNYASAGSGGPGHLAGELLNIMAGVKLQHIPYKGSGPALIDLIGGQVQLAFQTPLASIQYIKSGRLKAIAISDEILVLGLDAVRLSTEDHAVHSVRPARGELRANFIARVEAKDVGLPDPQEVHDVNHVSGQIRDLYVGRQWIRIARP